MWTKTIQSVAEGLYPFMKDYDVCLKVAEIYVNMRVNQGQSDSRRYHKNRLTWKVSPVYRSALPHYWSASHDLWTPSQKDIMFSAMIGYIGTERGARNPRWRVYAAAWGITHLDKDKITIKDKIEDMKIIPSSVIKQISQGRWDRFPDMY